MRSINFAAPWKLYRLQKIEQDGDDEEALFKSLIKLVAYSKLQVETDPLPLAAAHLTCEYLILGLII